MSFEGISPKSIGQTSSVMTKPMSASSMISRILDFGLAKSNDPQGRSCHAASHMTGCKAFGNQITGHKVASPVYFMKCQVLALPC